MMLSALQATRRTTITRAFSTGPVLPRITERRPEETGRGGRASDAGVKVCVFGATGFLGRYVTSGLGEYYLGNGVLHLFLLCVCCGYWMGYFSGSKRGILRSVEIARKELLKTT